MVAWDITVGETSMYADYIFPDLSYLERWEFMGSHPSVAQKVQPIFSPVINPIPKTVTVYGKEIPLSLEALLLGLAERLWLPGFGVNAFGPGLDFKRPEDLYLRMVANVAAGDVPGEEVPDADPAEVDLFLRARAHLSSSVYDPERWKRILGERWWAKAIYVLNRGGRFEDYERAYEGNLVRHTYRTLINLYSEKAATTTNSTTGRSFPGVATYVTVGDTLGRPLTDNPKDFPLQLITHREFSTPRAGRLQTTGSSPSIRRTLWSSTAATPRCWGSPMGIWSRSFPPPILPGFGRWRTDGMCRWWGS